MRTARLTTISAAMPSARPETSRATSVLVVQADPDEQWRIARMLTVGGHRVVGTSTGDGALALLAEWPVDLVLIDDTSPDINGACVAAQIRAARADVAVVLMTHEQSGSSRPAIGRYSDLLGWIRKPLRQDDVDHLLHVFSLDASG